MIYESVNIPLWRALKGRSGLAFLDVGCGSGALGELLTQNGNTVDGITYSNAEAAIAKDRIASVRVLNLNDLDAVSRVDVLIQQLDHSRPAVRRDALVSLAEIGPAAARALPRLIECLEDPDPMVSSTADVEVVDVGDLAIPAYDDLAASQVLPRLEGLRPGELDAVRRYEASHRHRKTVLGKIAQLQSSAVRPPRRAGR